MAPATLGDRSLLVVPPSLFFVILFTMSSEATRIGHQVIMALDVDVFISEVSIRPPLWDISLKEYSNRDVKTKLWIEVAKIVIEKWEELTNEEKNKEGEYILLFRILNMLY